MKKYLIPDLNNLKESWRLAAENECAFEYNDFFLPDVLDNKEEIKRITDIYRKLDRDMSEDTLHGAFLDIVINSADKEIRSISRKRVMQSMNVAEEMGIRGVIFHTNYIDNFKLESYRDKWVSDNEAFWREILKKYPNLCVYIENMFDNDPELLAALAEKMSDEKRFGVCFDYAHASVSSTPLEIWTEKLSKYIKHIHINDNDLKMDLHETIGSMKIDWIKYNELISRYNINASVLIEIKNLDKQASSIQYMKENKLYPFND